MRTSRSNAGWRGTGRRCRARRRSGRGSSGRPRRRPVVGATQRRERVLGLAGNGEQPVAGRVGQRNRAHDVVLGRREFAPWRSTARSTRIVPAWKSILSQRSASSSPGRMPSWTATSRKAANDGGVSSSASWTTRARSACAWRLRVAAARGALQPQLREWVVVDEPSCGGAGGVVEERLERVDGAAFRPPFSQAATCSSRSPDRKVAVLGDELLGPLAVVDVRATRRSQPQRVGRPNSSPELADGDAGRAFVRSRRRASFSAAARGLGRRRFGPPIIARRWNLLPVRGLRTRVRQRPDGSCCGIEATPSVVVSSARSGRCPGSTCMVARSCAQRSPATAGYRRTRIPHVSDGSPSASHRLIVDGETPNSWASSARSTYRSSGTTAVGRPLIALPVPEARRRDEVVDRRVASPLVLGDGRGASGHSRSTACPRGPGSPAARPRLEPVEVARLERVAATVEAPGGLAVAPLGLGGAGRERPEQLELPR